MTEFKASLVAFEVQKSFANKFFSNKAVAKTLIDDTSSHLLDNLYLLLFVFVSILHQLFQKNVVIRIWQNTWASINLNFHFQTKNKKDSEKTTRNIIKISIKLGMLLRGDKFSSEEKEFLVKIQKTLRTVAMTLISFYEVDHTYDRNFVIKYLTELETLLKNLISKHLTDKSLARVEQIFGVVKTPEFLDNIYVPKRNVEMRDIMAKVVKDLNNCIEAGVLQPIEKCHQSVMLSDA